MNKLAITIGVIGIVICLIAGALLAYSGKSFEGIEDSKKYDGLGGEMKIEGYTDGGWLIVTMKGKYADGSGYVMNKTADLTKEDCDLVTNFTLTNSEGENYFTPHCKIDDDTTEDEWIHVGYLCRKGCSDGAYTWDTNNTLINVWDGDEVGEALAGGLIGGGAGLFACCCGVVILLIGIILVFTMEDDNSSQYYGQDNSNHPLLNKDQSDGSQTYEKKGWDQQDDYIHKEKDEEEESSDIKEEKPAEKKRSGEYESPPPPEY